MPREGRGTCGERESQRAAPPRAGPPKAALPGLGWSCGRAQQALRPAEHGPERPGLERADLLGLRALRALAGGEVDPLVLLEAAEAVSLDGGVVNEDVGGAVVRGNEAVTLVGVKPLHGALSHVLFSYRNDLRDPRMCVPGCCDRLPSKAGP